MKVKSHFLFLSLLAAVLLSLSWYWHLTVFIFFGFVPLLVLEDRISSLSDLKKPQLKLLAYTFLTFFLWNILVTWWVVHASFGGACMAFIFNALFMAIVFVIFSAVKKKIAKPWAVWLLIPLWIAWEHGHTLWDLSWTWLTLGNVFAFNHNWVQWYEYTGTSGGTLWALSVNILVFRTIKNNTFLKFFSKPVMKIAVSILFPVVVSYLVLLFRLSTAVHNKKEATTVLVVQPNIDPYNVKFYLDYQSQFFKMLSLVKGKIKPETEYLVLPETFITGIDDDLNEEVLNQYEEIKWFRDSLISRFPRLKIITGGNTYVYYHQEKDITATARKNERNGSYYDVFNTAIYIDRFNASVYHKSKLVPGVERMPFPALLKPLESLAINMGGTMGSLGTQSQRAVFSDASSKRSIAPVICYESVYADYVTEYIRKGADFIFIITNDGWWEDTPGYIQHLNYARLRAIENRRQIARSANTGISCFMDEFGNISDATPWWKEAVIEKTLYPNRSLTFFSHFGDLISYISVLMAVFTVAWWLLLRFKKAV
jgi:apolipoprotein N-acyltransferase